jgi:hypothetical protein
MYRRAVLADKDWVLGGAYNQRHWWPMDEKQNADLTRSLDQIINILRAILIALWAIFGLLWFRHYF